MKVFTMPAEAQTPVLALLQGKGLDGKSLVVISSPLWLPGNSRTERRVERTMYEVQNTPSDQPGVKCCLSVFVGHPP